MYELAAMNSISSNFANGIPKRTIKKQETNTLSTLIAIRTLLQIHQQDSI